MLTHGWLNVFETILPSILFSGEGGVIWRAFIVPRELSRLSKRVTPTKRSPLRFSLR